MSLNKILNRPLFRKEALKKGVLKTINANTGVMVGQPYTGAPVPALRKPPNFMERMSVSGPVRGVKALGRNIFNLPAAGGYIAGEKVAQALGIEDPVGQTVFGLGGAYAGTRALPALAGIGALPSAIIGAAGYGLYDRTKAGIAERKRINAMSPAERKAFEIENRNKAFSYMGEGVSDADLFGKFKPKPIEEKVVKSKEIIEGRPGSGRVSLPGKSNSKTLKSNKALTSSKMAYNDLE